MRWVSGCLKVSEIQEHSTVPSAFSFNNSNDGGREGGKEGREREGKGAPDSVTYI